MPNIQFTVRNIDKLNFDPAKGPTDYFDTTTKGLGLRVGKGSKTFFVKADVADSTKPKGFRTVRKVLGRFGELTLEQARKEFSGYDDKEKGYLPGKRLEIKRGKSLTHGSDVTLEEMLEAYFLEKRTSEGRNHKPATVRGYTNIVTRHFQDWLPLTLTETTKLTPEVVIARYRQTELGHGPYGARNAFTMLTAIINYALVKYPAAISSNPLNVLRLGKHMKKIQARTEHLEGKEFQVFNEGIQKFGEVIRDCYLFCLYHGLRSEEASCLRWDQVDLEQRTINIPDTKNRRPLHVPLSRQSLAILEKRRTENPEDSPWVFPSIKRGRLRPIWARRRCSRSPPGACRPAPLFPASACV